MPLIRSIVKGRWGYFFIGPAYVLFTIFTIYPLFEGIRLSFYDAGLKMRTWVGFENYARLLTDSAFRRAFLNTLHFVVIIVPVILVLSLLFAVLIFGLNYVLQSIFRAAFYLPSVASGVVLVAVWLWIYNPTYGLLNYLTGLVGLPRIAWLGDARWALPALSVVVISWALGRPIILFIAGLNGISREVYEAAMIDGASSWQQFIRITLPLLTPTTVFVLVTQTIGVFQTFVVVQLLTRGGPAYATQTIVYSIYVTAFQFLQFGYAAAMGGVLLVVSGSIALFQLRLMLADIEY